MRSFCLNSALAAVSLGLVAGRAFAHTGDAAGGVIAGFYHPIGGADHAIAMIAVGLWGAQLGAPLMWSLPIAFPVLMALGGMLGMLAVPLPGVEIGIALSAVVLGIAVLAEWKAPAAAAVILVAAFAVFHGHAHGTEIPADASGVLYSVGFVVATGLLHAVGICIGLIHRWPKGKMALRACGGAVAACGLYFLYGAIA